ncbi:MAG: HAMP domain-containing protein [Gemmataceae bacterium]|nr:HAMP domain-containing protein [Gemmataceae bacterium]
MKSIRRSLLVYFLLLGLGSLTAVSWLAFRSARSTLEEKVESTRNLILAQHRQHVEDARSAFDRRLLERARQLGTTLSREGLSPNESLNALGLLGMPVLPAGPLHGPLWALEGMSPWMTNRLHRMRPIDMFFLVEDGAADDSPTEYCQTYYRSGSPWQRSRSLKEKWFELDPQLREKMPVLEERFDELTLKNGDHVRRVTIKMPKTRVLPALPWRQFGKGLFNPQPSNPSRPRGEFLETTMIFVQYAAELRPLERHIRHFEEDKTSSLLELQADTDRRLAQLEKSFFIIGLITFLGLMLGGSFLVWNGLRPLRRLSEAVGEISDKDFRLRFDDKRVPDELKPIVERLTTTLDMLRQAFAREKQATQDISHELRTPLAALMATLDVALKKQRNAEEYRELLEECRGSADYMGHLVERLMALARLDAGTDRLRMQTFELNELGRGCLDMIRPLASAKGITLRGDLDESLVVEADADKLREIIVNLLHNAVEYNRHDGTIDLSIRSEGQGVVLEVRDTGIGIAPDALPRLFERFYRADPSRFTETPHCGLGLSIVKSYVDLMAGRVDVESGPDGTTFRIHLPLRPRVEAIASMAS